MLNIIVCIKQVPNTNEVKLDPVTGTLIRDGVPSIINPDDKAGLEAALRLKDELGAHVTVISMGPAQADAALRRSALQMRMTELIGRISAAAPGEKAQLEQAYDACLADYRALR